MNTISDAIEAIRHVFEEHGDEYSRLGGPADFARVEQMARMRRREWPLSYVEIIAEHDGFSVHDTTMFSFLESLKSFMPYLDDWDHIDGFWPISSDEHGNLYAIAFDRKGSTGEHPIVYFNLEEDIYEPVSVFADSYAKFVIQQTGLLCESLGCNKGIPD